MKKVKRSTSYIIEDPVSVPPTIMVWEAVKIMETQGVTSLLVIDNGGSADGELVGIFTSRDYLFEEKLDKKISEVMTPRERLVTAPYGIELDKAKKFCISIALRNCRCLKTENFVLITTKDLRKLEQCTYNASRDEKGAVDGGRSSGSKRYH